MPIAGKRADIAEVCVMSTQRITIAGAGLVGSLLSTMLAKRGYDVTLFERRADMRAANMSAGRSINLAMSDRGLRALEVAGLADDIRAIAIPMAGRIMHDVDGTLTYQPYGTEGQAINSVSRGELNKKLMTLAEESGVRIHFSMRCVDADLAQTTATFEHTQSGERVVSQADVLFGADGAFSAIRGRMQMTDRYNYSQSYLPHDYKELHIPPTADGGFRLDPHALHIWPRHSYMIIALPNIDGSFTVTLFLAHDGEVSFSSLTSRDEVQRFFEAQFADLLPHLPTLHEDWEANPASSLVTVRANPWVANDTVALIGDAAHAIVPFYGQGMNCGFEDCRVLMDCLDATSGDWKGALELYQSYRIPDGHAIADLALMNFVEMRDKVADARFLRQKKIEAFLYDRYPSKFVPLYTMVTFRDDIPYSEALRIGAEQDVLMAELMADPLIYDSWTTAEAVEKLDRVMNARADISVRPVSPQR